MASDAPFDPCASEDVAACLPSLAGEGRALVTQIHPSDEMYRFDLAGPHRSPETAAIRYFAAAHSIFRTVSEVVAWRFGNYGGVRSFLDFASGYGRATRFLARALDPARITAAEIDPGAVRFQEQAFGVRGCVCGTDPGALSCPGPFDVVLAVSFFSHLPAARFGAWLACLYALVGDGGVLIFSTHGPELLPEGETMPAAGLAFRPESETARLDQNEYGTSWVTADFVRATAAGSAGRLFAFPRGLCGHQDLYALAKPPHPPGADLRLSRDPLGALMAANVDGGVVMTHGWAAGDRDERPPDVRLHLGRRLVAVSPGEGVIGGRREWGFTFPVSAVSPDAVVRIEAESPRGATRLLVAESLRPYLPGSG
ncbi:MAG TPA: class I SAM-dependent methyltransferase [Thermoanaerobaculia bacterium]|nr:class I SAM-dependent methyltransferase [Thermoanaerobaculia bacterium]